MKRQLLFAGDQRWRQRDHRFGAVVGATDQPRLVQPRRQVAAQQPLRLIGRERSLGGLIADQLDRPEVAVAANVADQWDVA